jgi:hypothetical protein
VDMESAVPGTLDYELILREAGECSTEALISFLSEELPYIWRDAYLLMTPDQSRSSACSVVPLNTSTTTTQHWRESVQCRTAQTPNQYRTYCIECTSWGG